MDTAVTLLNRFMLGLCIWREARGETPKGRRLVGAVIRNRLASPRWPREKNYVDVVLAPYQFSSFNLNDPNVAKYPEPEDDAWPDCVAAADDTFSAPTPITTANHYHVAGLDPAWRDDKKVVAVEGHHIFYAL
jgi:spore germination cell wall hydrolase CwlJ-like protein